MSHDPHAQLPGSRPLQILVTGCGECEARSRQNDHGISHLNPINFRCAWKRAAARQQAGLADVSQAEIPLLDTLWAVQLQLEQLGLPIGELPGRNVFAPPF